MEDEKIQLLRKSAEKIQLNKLKELVSISNSTHCEYRNFSQITPNLYLAGEYVIIIIIIIIPLSYHLFDW